jgi:SpoIID/LytB domain protein
MVLRQLQLAWNPGFPPRPQSMLSRRLVLALVAVAALVGPAGATPQGPAPLSVTTFVITGRGWGHGVGMAQWGAYGYAEHGVAFEKILAHFYPGTKLAPGPAAKIKVLLIDSTRKIVVSSADPFTVVDAEGMRHQIAGGNYPLTAALKVKLAPDSPPQALPGPLRFVPGTTPLWLAHPWRGELIVSANGKTLSVVNSVALDSYVRGVISNEMPRDWPLEAVKAQAVAARSYALAHHRGGEFDVFSDTRDQVYGGIATETPVGDQAVAATKRQVLLYDGKVATTYFFSSSGGMTASIADVFAGSKPVPYLVSVPDPYDTASPWHTWGPVVVSAAAAARELGVPGLLALKPVPATGRPRAVVAVGRNGDVVLLGGELRRALGLRSAWIRVGVLLLSRPAGPVVPGATVTLSGRTELVKGVTLEQRAPGGVWQAGPALTVQPDSSFSIAVAPSSTTEYRLAASAAKGAALRVIVMP